MNRSFLINVGLQFVFAAARYGMMGWVYARSDLEAVGHISALLTYVTAITFVAGIELHHVVNRSLLLGQGSELRWGADRLVVAVGVIGAMAWFSDFLLFGTSKGEGFKLLVFLVAVTEYLALETGRLLIIKSRYLVVTVGGFVRTVAPYLVAIVASPTLEAMLCSWFLGSALVLAVQAALLLRGAYFRVEFQVLGREDYRSAALFFAAGVPIALMPTIERWLTGTFFNAAVLGQYVIAVTMVSLCELVMQGGIWQPFIARILERLAQPALRKAAVCAMLVTIATVYLGGGVLALLLSDHLTTWVNKEALPSTMLLGAFALGLAKALHTLLFYCLYATNREQALPKIQVFMVATLILAVALGAYLGVEAGMALAAAAAAWTGTLLVLILRWTVG